MNDLDCRDETRRQVIREQGHNGVDYVDVSGNKLCVHFITGIPEMFVKVDDDEQRAEALKHIVISGGRRIRNIVAIAFDAHATDDLYDEDCLRIELDRDGDWSTYTLCFVELDEGGEPTSRPLASLDPRYACVDFKFKVDCPAELDCKTDDVCPTPQRPQPSINYLARDYESFRQLILDRLALVMPEWRERHVPDVGIALVEVLAYVADYLSYYQDAVATEAYLDTARLRISVRRHARLVDYRMHDGCNARAFLFLEVVKDATLALDDLYFSVDTAQTIVFEPLDERKTFPVWLAHNEIRFYMWEDRECCIAKGAMSATLLDEFLPVEVEQQPEKPAEEVVAAPKRGRRRVGGGVGAGSQPAQQPQEPPRKLHLQVGDFLLFEELACAGTVDDSFDPQHPQPMPDADRTHRHVVRLTKVTPNVDPLKGKAVVDVEWSAEDALPFTLCVSAIGPAPECKYVEPLAVARGNILLVDHGQRIEEPLDPIVGATVEQVCEGEDDPSEITNTPQLYRPVLKSSPLTFAEPLIKDAAAAVLLAQDPRSAIPSVTLRSDARRLHGVVASQEWTPVYDLLDSSGDDLDFVAEVDDDGRAHLRFGDGDTGRAVEVGTNFAATYRAGNGRAGLVGAGTITRAWFRSGPNNIFAGVRNPLPSAGAYEPEPIAEVKLHAPFAFRKDLQRAVTAADYATLAKYLAYPVRNPKVQNAAGSLVWSGSWYEADVAVDPFGSSTLAPALRKQIVATLARFRRMGHDLSVAGAESVPLALDLDLCVKPDYLKAHVRAAVEQAIEAFFQPDNTTFGEAVYVSRIVAAVMAIDGVADVTVKRLEPLGGPAEPQVLASGILTLLPNQIARLDNDPVQPENGLLKFTNVGGGR